MTTDLSGLRLHAHFDEGSGPVIVMLHGINSDGGDWRTVIDTIGPGYRFISFDLLGFGESPKPLDIDYTADEHALVIENTLLDLGVDDQFLLVGYSLGGCIALRYASTYPNRLRRLFLLDAPFYLPASELHVSGVGLKYLLDVGSQKIWDALAGSKKRQSFLYKLATGAIEKPLEDAFHSEDIPTHWDVMSKNLMNTVNKATWVDDLPKLTMPVVHAIGIHDAIVPISQAPALKRLKPEMEIRKIGGLAADHMVLWNMPERVAEEIVRDEVRELNVVWRGGTGEPLLLLHGTRNPASAWIPIAEALAHSYDVACIDLLGFGDSPAPLSLHFTLSDHVAAVLGTVGALWGQERAVTFVGEGLGATVALGCAATVPQRSTGVVALSAGLLEPGTTVDDLATDERSARIVAVRDMSHRLAEAASRSGRAAEKLETRLVPLLRSVENTMLGTDAAELLAQVPAPVRFVTPQDDPITPAGYLACVADERDGFESLTVPGERGVFYAVPGTAVRAIAPDDAAAAEAADRAVPASPESPLDSATASAESTLLRTGVLNLAAAVAVMLVHPQRQELLTWGFALWVTFASLSAIVGAVTMKSKTAGQRFSFVTTALPTLLMGVAGLAIASFLVADPDNGRRLFGVVVAVYAMARGAADLWLARNVEEASKPRWLLYAGGALGIFTAVAVVFGPDHGKRVVRLVLAAYLALSGLSLVGYVVKVRRDSERRVRELLARQR